MSEHTPREHSYSPGEDGSAEPQSRNKSQSRHESQSRNESQSHYDAQSRYESQSRHDSRWPSRYEPHPRCVTRDDVAPLFQTDAFVNGSAKKIRLSDYKGDWVVLFFYSSDFTFV